MTQPNPHVRASRRATWYLSHPRYIKHMAQEITSFFIGGYALLLLWGIRALASGEEAWNAFLVDLGSPLARGLLWVVLAATLYHAVSWFAVTPKAMPVQIGEDLLPGSLIAGAHYVAWFAASLFILLFAGAI